MSVLIIVCKDQRLDPGDCFVILMIDVEVFLRPGEGEKYYSTNGLT